MIMCQEYHKISNLKDAKDQRRGNVAPKKDVRWPVFQIYFLTEKSSRPLRVDT